MNTTAFRRITAIAGAAAIATAGIAVGGTTASAGAEPRDTAGDRPCFMIRSNWNDAEGPQPTCGIPWREAPASEKSGAARPAPSVRVVTDFMS